MEPSGEQNTTRKTTWIWWRTFSVAGKFWIHILGLLCNQVRTRLMRWIVVRSKHRKRTALKQILSRQGIPYFDPPERHDASRDTKRIRSARAETIKQYKSTNAYRNDYLISDRNDAEPGLMRRKRKIYFAVPNRSWQMQFRTDWWCSIDIHQNLCFPHCV